MVSRFCSLSLRKLMVGGEQALCPWHINNAGPAGSTDSSERSMAAMGHKLTQTNSH